MLAATTGGPIFEVSGWVSSVITLGAICAALTAVAALFRRSKLGRPLRWVYSHLIGQPVTTFFTEVVGGIVEEHVAPLKHELTPNNGSSMLDKVDTLLRSEEERRGQLRKLQEQLAELYTYSHTNTHAINEAIAVLTTAMQYAEGFVPALGSMGDELKATRKAITDAKDDAATVVETARVVAENVLKKAEEDK